MKHLFPVAHQPGLLLVGLLVAMAALSATRVLAEDPPVEVPPREAIVEARQHVKNGAYDEATMLLETAIQSLTESDDLLRDAYVELVKVNVMRSNYWRFRPQGREPGRLFIERARELVRECLGRESLRDAKPDPPSEYPSEMITLFDEVRREMFGAFRIVGLHPSDSHVFIGDTPLKPMGEEAGLFLGNLPTGKHLVVVRREGYQDLTDEIAISPGSTLEQDYILKKNRGAWWYTWRGTAVAAATLGLANLVTSGVDGAPSAEQELPGPPDPPRSQ